MACAWQLHTWCRWEFLARQAEQGAEAEANRQLAERHAGSITVNSQPGEGTTFQVALPIHPLR